MPKILSVGSALIDIFIRSPHFQLSQDQEKTLLCQTYGEKLDVESLDIHTGGGGCNTAIGFSRMGFSTGLVAELGRDPLSLVIKDKLAQEKVSSDFLILERQEQTGGSVILVGSEGGRTVMVHRGAASMLDATDLPLAELASSDWIHLSSCGGRQEVIETIFDQVKTAGTGLSWNPGQGELSLLVNGSLNPSSLAVKILILNAEEWGQLADVQAELKLLIPEIVVTDGSHGGTLYEVDTQPQTYQSVGVESVDDTGAGDAFSVGYVSARLLDNSPAIALEWGKQNAASVIQHVGATPGLLSRADIR